MSDEEMIQVPANVANEKMDAVRDCLVAVLKEHPDSPPILALYKQLMEVREILRAGNPELAGGDCPPGLC